MGFESESRGYLLKADRLRRLASVAEDSARWARLVACADEYEELARVAANVRPSPLDIEADTYFWGSGPMRRIGSKSLERPRKRNRSRTKSGVPAGQAAPQT